MTYISACAAFMLHTVCLTSHCYRDQALLRLSVASCRGGGGAPPPPATRRNVTQGGHPPPVQCIPCPPPAHPPAGRMHPHPPRAPLSPTCWTYAGIITQSQGGADYRMSPPRFQASCPWHGGTYEGTRGSRRIQPVQLQAHASCQYSWVPLCPHHLVSRASLSTSRAPGGPHPAQQSGPSTFSPGLACRQGWFFQTPPPFPLGLP